MLSSILVLGAADLPTLAPSKSGLPGGDVAGTFVNGVGFYGLLFTLVGAVLSAGMWAVGAFSSNYTQSVNGKKGFLIAAGAAIAIGASTNLLSYFYGKGSSIPSS